jgi:tetratricopeptide (TPR) repeat protein
MLNSELGRVGDVIEGLAAYAAESPLPAWRAALANAYAAVGRRDEASRELAAIIGDGLAEIPKDSVWLATLGELAKVVAALGAVEDALSLYPLLTPYADRMCVVGGGFMCLGPISWFLGLLAATIGDIDAALEHFEHALASSRDHGSPPFAARAATDLARCLLVRGWDGDHRRAVSLLEEARATAGGLGMEGLVIDIDDLLPATPAGLITESTE